MDLDTARPRTSCWPIRACAVSPRHSRLLWEGGVQMPVKISRRRVLSRFRRLRRFMAYRLRSVHKNGEIRKRCWLAGDGRRSKRQKPGAGEMRRASIVTDSRGGEMLSVGPKLLGGVKRFSPSRSSAAMRQIQAWRLRRSLCGSRCGRRRSGRCSFSRR